MPATKKREHRDRGKRSEERHGRYRQGSRGRNRRRRARQHKR